MPFVKAAKFDRLGVFSYSDEETSGSYQLDAKVDARTIYNRKRSLMAIAATHLGGAKSQTDRREFPVLIEGPSKETDLLWEGRLSTQAPEIDGVVYINDFNDFTPKPGEIRMLQVTEAHDYDLVGELVGDAIAPAPQIPTLFQILPGSVPRPPRSPLTVIGENRIVKCPICKKPVSKDDPNMPFCSDRCRLIDLGNWASEKYVISEPLPDPDEIEDEFDER